MSDRSEFLKNLEVESLKANESERLEIQQYVFRNLIRRAVNLRLYVYCVMAIVLLTLLII